jgi:hypothetical protein
MDFITGTSDYISNTNMTKSGLSCTTGGIIDQLKKLRILFYDQLEKKNAVPYDI